MQAQCSLLPSLSLLQSTDELVHGATGAAAVKPERRGGTDVSAGEVMNAAARTSRGPGRQRLWRRRSTA
jgi:hypothetical protein